ncbi:MAG TPA: DUF4388 domain-containing protein [Polyangiaceae bacterium]|nr:DUF4388 domain-containing protein [Polyangiaceae bacterium]
MADVPARGFDLHIDAGGAVHPVGAEAGQALRAHAGDWRLLPSPPEVLLAVAAGGQARVLRLAGEVRTPGGLCDIIATMAQSSAGGEVAVFDGAARRSLFFEDGNVVGATTTAPTERIGEILWRFGAITREQQESIVQEAARSGRRIGDAAIQLGLIAPDELFRMMARQVEEVFYAAVQVKTAAFYWFDRFDEHVVTHRHILNAGQLLMEAARRTDELRFFRERIPTDAYVPVRLPVSGNKKAPPDLEVVLSECDGQRSVAEIGRRVGYLEFEVTRAVFQLCTTGLVAVTPPKAPGPSAVEIVNRALLEIHRTCDAAAVGQALRAALAKFAMSTGVYVPLFHGAGPVADGSLQGDRIAKNVTMLAGGDDAEAWLTQQLFDYAGFALFHAGSLLPRVTEAALKARVSQILRPPPRK